jgi:hypothetical protein
VGSAAPVSASPDPDKQKRRTLPRRRYLEKTAITEPTENRERNTNTKVERRPNNNMEITRPASHRKGRNLPSYTALSIAVLRQAAGRVKFL